MTFASAVGIGIGLAIGFGVVCVIARTLMGLADGVLRRLGFTDPSAAESHAAATLAALETRNRMSGEMLDVLWCIQTALKRLADVADSDSEDQSADGLQDLPEQGETPSPSYDPEDDDDSFA